MKILHILEIVLTKGFSIIGVKLSVLSCIITGILVIIITNPIVSILSLIVLFVSVSIYLMFLGLGFLGLSYILVYVGAVSILFLFILMLINIRVSEIISPTRNSILLALLLSILFFSTVKPGLPLAKESSDEKNMENFIDLRGLTFDMNEITDRITLNPYLNNNLEYISKTFSFFWEDSISNISHITSIGNILYTNFPILIFITSLVLLLSMVGSILITVKI